MFDSGAVVNGVNGPVRNSREGCLMVVLLLWPSLSTNTLEQVMRAQMESGLLFNLGARWAGC